MWVKAWCNPRHDTLDTLTQSSQQDSVWSFPWDMIRKGWRITISLYFLPSFRVLTTSHYLKGKEFNASSGYKLQSWGRLLRTQVNCRLWKQRERTCVFLVYLKMEEKEKRKIWMSHCSSSWWSSCCHDRLNMIWIEHNVRGSPPSPTSKTEWMPFLIMTWEDEGRKTQWLNIWTGSGADGFVFNL